jgi:hypothetical protein
MKQLALILTVAAATTLSLRAESLTATRPITEWLVMSVPQAPCAVPAIAARISEITGIPAGIEFVPGCALADPKRPPGADEISLQGLTAEEALDRLIASDPRYRWAEVDGMILVRPLDAWTDVHHFMNATISDFGFLNQNVEAALVMLLEALRGEPIAPPTLEIAGRTDEGNRRFSLPPRTTSILEAANDVVRAHGALHWTLSYCKPERRLEYTLFMLQTFDHSGGGGEGPRSVVRGADGRLRSVCAPD